MDSNQRAAFDALRPQDWSTRAADRRAILVQTLVDRLGPAGAAEALGIHRSKVDEAIGRVRHHITPERHTAAMALDKIR